MNVIRIVGVLGIVLLALAARAAERIDSPRADTKPALESKEELIVRELETLPDDVTVDMTEEEFPEVYGFFEAKIAADAEGRLSPFEVLGCPTGGSLNIVPMSGGMLGTLDKGDGVVHVLAYAIGGESLGPEQTDGLALSAVITEDGVEILWIDLPRLAQFVAAEQSDSLTAELEQRAPPPVADTTTTMTADLDCFWTSERVCCAVATEAKFCVCCASLIPVRVGCSCVPLVAQ